MRTKEKISGYIIRNEACAVFLSVAFIALRRRTVMRRFEIGKDHKITHSIGRRPRKTLTCTLPLESHIHSSSVAPHE